MKRISITMLSGALAGCEQPRSVEPYRQPEQSVAAAEEAPADFTGTVVRIIDCVTIDVLNEADETARNVNLAT